ncbi:hypothetical protein ABE10_11380 [Bacillus toyonensis]|nr:hypothetical protein [Bacillus toyonensis]
MNRALRTSAAAVAAALTALSLAGCAPSEPSPSAVVTDYLQALADGDTDAALKLLPVGSDREMLSADAKPSATISDFKVDDASDLGDATNAQVGFSYKLDGEEQMGTAMLTKSDEGAWSLLSSSDGSALTLATLNVTSSDLVTKIVIGGQEVSASEGLAALPGVYDVEVTVDPKFEVADPKRAIILGIGGSASVEVGDVIPTDETTAEAVAAAQTYLDACVAGATNAQPSSCPFRHAISGEGIDGTWQVSQPISADVCEFNAGSVTLECTLDPSAVTFIEPEFRRTPDGPVVLPEKRSTGDQIKVSPLTIDLLTMTAK